MIVVVADYQTITVRHSPASLPGDVDVSLADHLESVSTTTTRRSTPTPSVSTSAHRSDVSNFVLLAALCLDRRARRT
jgi:hypothetical protein